MDYEEAINEMVDAGLIIGPFILFITGILVLFIIFLLGGGFEWIKMKRLE